MERGDYGVRSNILAVTPALHLSLKSAQLELNSIQLEAILNDRYTEGEYEVYNMTTGETVCRGENQKAYIRENEECFKRCRGLRKMPTGREVFDFNVREWRVEYMGEATCELATNCTDYADYL